jgi:GntR family transcriptional regulator/MocR family aminotransferase
MPIPAEAFHLDRTTEGTLQQKLQRQVAEGILSGRFRPGERMPSSRKLADHLGVARITVTIAYTELVAGDYLTARGRSGYFVSDSAPRSPRFDLPPPAPDNGLDWPRHLARRYTGARDLTRPDDWRRYPYPFIYGQTDPRLFDHQNWRLCALQALGQKDFDADPGRLRARRSAAGGIHPAPHPAPAGHRCAGREPPDHHGRAERALDGAQLC